MGAKVGGLFVSMAASAARIKDDFDKARRAAQSSTNGMRKDFRSASKSTQNFSSKLGGLKTAAIAAAGPAALGLLIKKSLDAADRIAKIADTAGFSTDALQELSYAADLAGISTGDFETALQAFNKRIGEARNGTGTLITILNKMDKQLLADVQAARTTEEAFDLIIDAAGKTATSMDQAALLAAAFGRTVGVKMSRLVMDGADNLAHLRSEAQRLGIVIEEDLLRGAETAKDSLATMGRVISSQLTSAVIQLAPQITNITTSLTESLPKLIQWVNKFLEFAGIKDKNPLDDYKDALAYVNTQLEIQEQNLANAKSMGDTLFGEKYVTEYTAEIDKLTNAQQLLEGAIKRIENAEKKKSDTAKAAADAAAIAEQKRYDAAVRSQEQQKQAADQAAADAATARKLEADRITAEEKNFQTIAAFSQAAHEMQTDQFQLQREQLMLDVENWRAAGVMKTEIEKMEAEKRKQIAADEFAFKMAKANEIVNAIANLANQVVEIEKAAIDRRLVNDQNKANTQFAIDKARLVEQNSVNGELTEKGLEQVGNLEQAHQARMSNLRDAADNDKRRAAKKLKPMKIAQSISNTALAVTEALPNIPLAILIGALGAAEVATIAAQPFAKGGIVNRPTFFSHGSGLGIMGEVPGRSEAIMPLARGANGELGVQSTGGGSGEIVFQQINNFHGITEEKFINSKVVPQIEDGARRGINRIMTSQTR
jgi:hypothetical protein